MAAPTRDNKTALRKALKGLRTLKRRVAELEGAARAPIAVVGMACRFPGGVRSPEDLWTLLTSGEDAVGPVPADRWDASAYLGPAGTPGRCVTDQGGFLDDVRRFDADLFGLSHREGRSMDPQQRLLLEVSREALEDAGHLPRVRGTDAGVYMGVALTDWEHRTLRHPDPTAQDVYAGTGTFNSVASGRISYALGLCGPNVSLDTACSSSLVSVHLACQALRAGECGLALAGGVNLILSPDASLYFSQMGALAPDGRCKAFDHRADGYVRSEGVGVVVLRRLDDALADGDRILAVIPGSAVNQDGRSNGLTAPSVEAQRQVLRQALERAGLTADQVGYVEAHGTGTPLGDPIEFDALASVYGAGLGPEAPLVLGAVKTVIGHAEAAAGVAGLIKTVLALQHGAIPGNLHLQAPNPRLALEGSRFALAQGRVAWTERRVAGVSSFGMSGTNAHVLLAHPEALDASVPEPVAGDGPWILPVSAPDAPRLEVVTEAAVQALATVDAWGAVLTAQRGREALAWRRVAVVDAPEALPRALSEAEAVQAPRRAPRLGLWIDGAVPEGASLVAAAAREPAVEAAWAEAEGVCPTVQDVPLREAVAEGLDHPSVRHAARWVAARRAAAVLGTPTRIAGEGEGEAVAAVLAGAMSLAALLGADEPGGRRPAARLSLASHGGVVQTLEPARLGDGGDEETAWGPLDEAVGLWIAPVGSLPDGLSGVEPGLHWARGVARAWTLGAAVDWEAVCPGPRRVVAWPRTPLAGPSLWLDDPVEAARTPATELKWAEALRPLEPTPSAPDAGWVVIGEGAEALAQALGGRVVDGLEALGPGERLVDLRRPEAVDALAAQLASWAQVRAAGARLTPVLRGMPSRATEADLARAGAHRVTAQEEPGAWGGLLWHDGETPDALAAALTGLGHREARVDAHGMLHGPRLSPAPGGSGARPRLGGTWWIPGGLGAVGRAVARRLAERGAARVVLTSRRAPDGAAAEALQALEEDGHRVEVVRGDVTDPADVARILDVLGPDLAGVVHAAGALDDARLDDLDAPRIEAVLAAKLTAARHLAEALADRLEVVLVMLSSATWRLGIPGQSAYAAANAALHGVVSRRRAKGGTAVAVDFGPWDLGMADPEVLGRLAAVGIHPLPTARALTVLESALADPSSDPIAVRFDPAVYAARTAGVRLAAYLGTSSPAEAVGPEATGRPVSPEALPGTVREVLAGVLGRDDPEALPGDVGLFDLGLDSMTAVAFARDLEARVGVAVPPTVAFDHGDVASLVRWLTDTLHPDEDGRTERAEPSARDRGEPIAIVGMGCRFPGDADGAEAFWRLLEDGVDALGPVPRSRWDVRRLYHPEPGTSGHTYVTEGAFLGDVTGFDAAWFGISPREAEVLDPQQRLLLEVGVEALEDAGIAPDALSRTPTGVFVGIGPSDYGRRFDPRTGEGGPYAGTGNEASFAAGRLAYHLGTRGPAVGLNTACSTSLVTTHLALEALRSGQCDVALAGGVHLMLTPDTTLQLSQLEALSPTARCHTFSADADGYARGEGCGLVVLMRASEARRRGLRIRALLLGGAVNHDGPSAGLTVPSGEAQQALMTTALADAGVAPEQVGFLEAHGTGTRLGDPIELRAVRAVYGQRSTRQPLTVSSVKTHIGHLELAAGVAGVLSAVLTLQHRRFAPHLHLGTPNPDLPLDFPVRIPTAPTDWETDTPRHAAVSSFGLSGTNAHLILREAEDAPPGEDTPRSHHLLVLHGAHPAAVRGVASRLADWIADHEVPLADVAWSLHRSRASRRHRAVVVAETAEDATAALRRVAEDAPLTVAPASAPPVVGLFTGQGAQHPGMARALHAQQPVFAEVLDRCEARYQELTGTSLLDVLFCDDPDDPRIHHTALTQPALYAVECGLAALWRSWGVVPDLVVGHSIGELAAAWSVGLWSLEDGLTAVVHRGRLMGELPEGGTMASVALSAEALQPFLEAEDGVGLAARNAPSVSVVSGETDAVERLVTRLTEEGVRCTRLRVSHAFHSHRMAPILDAFEEAIAAIPMREPTGRLISNLTGRVETTGLMEPSYWRAHIREAVRFTDAVAAAPDGAVFLELGPHPVLSGLVARARPDAVVVPSLRRGQPDGAVVARAVGTLRAQGVDVDLLGWDAPWHRRYHPLPPTPWVRERHWVEAPDEARAGRVDGLVYRPDWRPWSGTPVEGPVVWFDPDGVSATWGFEEARVVSTLQGLRRDELAGARVVSLVGLGTGRMPAEAVGQTLTVLRALPEGATLTVVTHGVCTGEGSPVVGGALAGLVRGIAQEAVARLGSWLDLDRPSAAALTVGVACPEVLVRVDGEGSVLTRRLVPWHGLTVDRAVRGTWWIPGGTGGVGRVLAEALVDAGAERLVLTSRRAPTGEAAAFVASLSERADVAWQAADVTRRGDLERVLASLDEGPPLRGVIHAAGRHADVSLARMEDGDVAAVMDAKVGGAVLLDALTRDRSLDAFVLLGSAAAELGWTGQANYGAANGALAGLAAARRASGLPATVIQYGPWATAGMATPEVRDAMAQVGMGALSAADGAATLTALLGEPEALVVDLDWTAWSARQPWGRTLAADLIPAAAEAPSPGGPATDDPFSSLDDHARRRRLEGLVREAVASTLGHADPGSLDASQGLFDLGLDSLMAVSLARALEEALPLTVRDTVAFDHPTIDALVAHLDDALTAATGPAAGSRRRGPSDEPIAIVGMGCRFPGGATSLEAYWSLLTSGRDAVGPVPADRWDADAFYDPTPGTPGRSYLREGAFLDGVREFEPAAFGLSPRQARMLDPQQRLLLEVATEALEHAGLAPDRLTGTPTAVYVGIGGHDYERILERAGVEGDDAAYLGTGNDLAFAAGRLAYHLGVRGPTLSLDTACSSSLVAAHLGVRSLRDGEADVAVAAGVRLMLSPESTLQLSALKALSPTARCHTFSHDADGYVRGEGCGAVVLKRLSDARADGDRVLAVIRGSAVNHDGASGGLTVPSGGAQRELLATALQEAGLAPEQVDYVEAHGTGTPLGDPIEVGALQQVLGERPADRPLALGSVKTQLGHLELAAGMAGLIKLVLSLQHDTLPGQLHFDGWNEAIPHDWPVQVLTQARPWPRDHGRAAGVSAFGLAGTNAHLVITDPPDDGEGRSEGVEATSDEGPWVLPVSATTSRGLDRACGALADHLDAHPGLSLADVAHTLHRGRAQRPHRRAVVARTVDEAVEGLRTAASIEGHVPAGAAAGGLAMLFTGQGAQHPGMSRGLYDRYPVFREVIDAADAHLRSLRGEGLTPVLFAGDDDPAIHDTAWTQPALFAVEVGLARLWQSFGVVPDVVVGHSIGELGAAVVAGMLSLQDGLTVVEARGRLMSALPRDGAMGAVSASADAVQAALADHPGVGIAAVNAPEATVVSGDEDGVAALLASFEARGVRTRALVVSHAFHSAKMEPMLEAFGEVAASVDWQAPRVPMVSTLTGALETEALTDPAYWVRQVRQAVRFAPAVRAAQEAGATWFLEVGPHPVLAGLGAKTLGTDGRHWLPSLRRGRDDLATLRESAARLHTGRRALDLTAVQGRGAVVSLPTTPWQRTTLWVEGGEAQAPVPPVPQVGVIWVPAPPAPEAPRGCWWVVVDEDGPVLDGMALADALSGAATLVTVGAQPADALEAAREASPPDRVLRIAGQAGSAASVAAREVGVRRAVGEILGAVPIHTLTHGAFGPQADPAQRGLWGLGRVVALEQPARHGGLIDHTGPLDPDAVARALRTPGEDAWWLQGDRAQVARLSPSATLGGTTPPGVVLLTGGTGAVGRALARRAADLGATAVVRVSRNAPTDDLDLGDVPLHHRAVDVTDAEAVAAVVSEARGLGEGPLTVVHGAGVLDDGPWSEMDEARFRTVLGPKLEGARHLVQALSDADRLVLVGSATATLGAHGQANYAVANAALEALAERRAAAGAPTVVLGYGPWSGAGMAAAQLDGMRRRGIHPLDPATAARALDLALGEGAPPVLAIAAADWSTYRTVHDPEARRSLLQELAPRTPAPSASDAAPSAATARPEDAPRAVREAVRRALGLSADAPLDPRQGVFDLGLDSLSVVTVADALAAWSGVEVPTAWVFDHPTVEGLTERLIAALEPADDAATRPVVTAATASDEPIALVGVGLAMPGAHDLDALWSVLSEGRSMVGPAPRDRWPRIDDLLAPEPGTPGHTYTDAGAFLDDLAGFEPRAFGMSPREAEALDPQQRLLLELAYRALQDGGWPVQGLRGSDAGVYVALGASEYDLRFHRGTGPRANPYAGPGNDTSFAAGRLAYVLGTHGPALSVNTACSASLVAVHLAVQDLRAGRVDVALAGGVNLMVSSDSTVRLAQLRALSPTGACRAFDADADGYVRGEGGAVVALQRLGDAQAEGRPILAVIRGSAVNHDGPSAGLTVPHGPSQTALLRRAWADAGLTPDDLGYVEAHGTGTRLGDPIEARALAAALGEREDPLPIGSVKTNLGHLELAAGVAGLLKVVAALRAREIPPSLHLERLNPQIPQDAPIEVVTARRPWTERTVAGVSSFGLSGTNAHVVLEAPPAAEADAAVPWDRPARVLPLAAWSEPSLTGLAAAVAERLPDDGVAPVAAAAAHRRVQGAWRLAVLADEAGPTAARLRGDDGSGRWIGQPPPEAPRTAWVFAGEGPVPVDTARALSEADPAFAAAWDEVVDRLADALGPDWTDGDDPLARHGGALAFAVAASALWRSWGLIPDVVVGHGLGELLAAWAAGVLSLDDTVTAVLSRAELLATVDGPWRALAVRAPEDAVAPHLADQTAAWLVARNDPRTVVVAGDPEAMDTVARRLETAGRVAREVPAIRGAHTPVVGQAARTWVQTLRGLTWHAPTVAWRGSMPDPSSPEAWGDHLSRPLRLADTVAALDDDGPVGAFLELSPRAEVLPMVRRGLADPRGRVFLPTARPGRAWATTVESLAEGWVAGLAVDWTAVEPAAPTPAALRLPPTPFARRRLWVEEPSEPASTPPADPTPTPTPAPAPPPSPADPPPAPAPTPSPADPPPRDPRQAPPVSTPSDGSSPEVPPGTAPDPGDPSPVAGPAPSAAASPPPAPPSHGAAALVRRAVGLAMAAILGAALMWAWMSALG